MRRAILLIFLSSFTLGQTIKGHSIGENLQDYIARTPNGSDQVQRCRTVGTDRKLAKKLKLDVAECSALLSAIDNGSRLVLSHPPKFNGDLTFENGRLSKMHFTIGEENYFLPRDQQTRILFEQVVSELAERFGAPSNHSDFVTQNGFGATFHHRNVFWDTPILHIFAFEADAKIDFPITGVTIETQDEYRRETAESESVKALD